MALARGQGGDDLEKAVLATRQSCVPCAMKDLLLIRMEAGVLVRGKDGVGMRKGSC